MADTILIRAGNKNGMPTLAEREVVYCKDENAFYIGTKIGMKTENKKVGPEVVEREPMANLPKLESTATLEDVIAGFNTLIDALIDNGLMEEGATE